MQIVIKFKTPQKKDNFLLKKKTPILVVSNTKMVIFVISKQQHFENVTPNSFQKIRITTTTTITEKKHFKTTINRPKCRRAE